MKRQTPPKKGLAIYLILLSIAIIAMIIARRYAR